MASFWDFMRLFLPATSVAFEQRKMDFFSLERSGSDYDFSVIVHDPGNEEKTHTFDGTVECPLSALILIEEYLCSHMPRPEWPVHPTDIFEQEHALPLLRGLESPSGDAHWGDPPTPPRDPLDAPF